LAKVFATTTSPLATWSIPPVGTVVASFLHSTVHRKAADGEYVIHVTGKPTKGEPTTVDVKVKVEKK
jgi:hypothetical protein